MGPLRCVRRSDCRSARRCQAGAVNGAAAGGVEGRIGNWLRPQAGLVVVRMIHGLFLLLVVPLAALSIWARMRRPRYYPWLKALPMLWILAYYCWHLLRQETTEPLGESILAGLILGYCGDVLLLYPRVFLLGFASFLAGHVAYLVAFVSHAPMPPLWFWPLAFAPGVVFASLISWNTDQRRSLLLVWPYAMMLSAMMAFAWWNDFAAGRLPILAAGAVLFAVSDGFWSWNRYVRPISLAAPGILVNYYSGQALIALGALLA